MLLLLAAFGFAWIVGHSTISLPFREFLGGNNAFDSDGMPQGWSTGWPPFLGPFLCKMIECPGCIGFHLGWLYELLIGSGIVPGPRWFAVIAVGAAVAGSNVCLGRLTKLIE